MLATETTRSGLQLVGAGSPAVPVLTMLEGEEASRTWLLGEKPLVLGRDLGNDIPLADARASRVHARVAWKNPVIGCPSPLVTVCDLGSTNGTWVNGRRVEGEVPLAEHDKLAVGNTLFGYARQVDEQIEAQRRLLQRATTDALTGLANREVFERTLRREFERARRYTRPLSLVIFDADDFKGVNDRHGHRVGDLVLRQLGRITRDNLRLSDLGARLGGEELAAILPETPVEAAQLVAERIRLAVAQFPMALAADALSVTVSAGVAELDGAFPDADAMFQAADAALYRAKRGGKNQTAAHRPGD